jgi:hypothetical protein
MNKTAFSTSHRADKIENAISLDFWVASFAYVAFGELANVAIRFPKNDERSFDRFFSVKENKIYTSAFLHAF